ncbi:MAG: thioredoxin family protein [Legionellales bacterium]|nr:thioredoxin family protein [Legionellales bacterium]
MSLTPSKMMPLGTHAPDFTLLDTVSGKHLSLSELKSDKATVIMFICNHCPFVLHIHSHLMTIARVYQAKGIKFIAISANDVSAYPEDAPHRMTDIAKVWRISFPYLYDETQEVAKAYDAACTPDLYVFDKDLCCVYRGQFDSSRPGNSLPVTGKDLSDALDAVLVGTAVNPDQKPSVGCNIKWKA